MWCSIVLKKLCHTSGHPLYKLWGARYSLQGCTGLQLLEERDFSVRRSDAAGVEVNPVSSYEINLVFDDRRENIVQVKDKGQAEK